MATFDTEQLAQSAYRVWHTAAAWPMPPWEHLGIEAQDRWLRLARRADPVLSIWEGGSYRQAGEALAGEFANEEQVLEVLYTANSRLPVAWEALARHLVALLDEAEDIDLDALERSWGPWAQQRSAA